MIKNISRVVFTTIGAVVLAMAGLQTVHAERGCYGVSAYGDPGPYYEAKARDSKCTSLFLFTLKIHPDSSLYYGSDATLLCKNGSYVGNSVWDQQLNGCRGGSISRIEMAIGEYESSAFDSVKSLILADGTGTGTILYRNMNALKNKIRLDAFQMDDEKTYNSDTMIRFCKMLKDGMGVYVSLCPYTDQGFWKTVKAGLPGRVTGVWLQCYVGGAGNDASQWRSALGTSVLYPGGQTSDSSSRFRGWRNQGFTGAFIWANKTVPDPSWGQKMIDGGF